MAKGQYILNVGDDNVVLVRLADGKVVNAWLGSPDPAMATEELGEALAEDPKAEVSVLIDTLDQSFKEEELPKVNILDRRRVVARHINLAFPGQNLRGARLVAATEKKTLLYDFASVPLEGRVLGWLDFANSLPNPKNGAFALAAESVDLISALVPKSAQPAEGAEASKGNNWRHLIGINVTGGLRQVIEKNGRLCLTRLTQAPPPETPPAEFADMILRDFKATITYIRRLGYVVGDSLDLVVLTTPENKAVMEDLAWDGARSVSIYTPYEAGLMLDLGSLGREDQAYADVLHAAWFASKPLPTMPLTRSATFGTVKDDIREVGFLAAPYAAGLLAAMVIGWTAWTGYDAYDISRQNADLEARLSQVRYQFNADQRKLASMPYDIQRMRNVLEVDAALQAGGFDIEPILTRTASALQGDAIVLSLKYTAANSDTTRGQERAPAAMEFNMRLAPIVVKAQEALELSRRIEQRLIASLGKDYVVKMTREPIGAKATESFQGGLTRDAPVADAARSDERFYATYVVAKAGP